MGEGGKLWTVVERWAGMAVVLVTSRWRTWGVRRELPLPKSRHSSSSKLHSTKVYDH